MSDEPRTAAEDARMAEFMGAVMKLSAQVKSMSAEPMFDERVLPDLMDSLFARTLGLTDGQVASLREVAVAELAKTRGALGDDALPVDRYPGADADERCHPRLARWPA